MNIIHGKIAKAQKFVLYGPEGIGKSTLASKFPNPLFIDTEGSTGNMDVARLETPSSWEMLKQEVQQVRGEQPCRTLIIDTMDWAERKAMDYICQVGQKKSIEDFGYGSGYIKLEEEIGRFLNLLNDLIDAGIHVGLTAHSQIRKFEQPDEMGAYDRYELKLGKKTSARTSALVKEWADMVLFINYKTISVAEDDQGRKHKAQGGTRTVYTTHHPAWDAKNRHNLPEEFPLEGAYEKYLAPIFEKQPEREVATTVNRHRQEAAPNPPAQSKTQDDPKPKPAETDLPADQTSFDDFKPELINKAIPKPLRDLMIANKVSEEEIQIAVADRGFYPQDTPITNYDPNFVSGVLVDAWDQVFGAIKEFRKNLPF